MFKSIFAGILLTAATVIIHAAGTTWWIRRLKQRVKNETSPDRFAGLKVLSATATVLLTLHIIEVGVWAVVYLALPAIAEVSTFEEAIYFSTVTFSSLGYDDIVIQGSWRLLTAIESMAGVLIFGWSTALLFAVVQRIWDVPEDTQQPG